MFNTQPTPSNQIGGGYHPTEVADTLLDRLGFMRNRYCAQGAGKELERRRS
jgi:hypothetical protein